MSKDRQQPAEPSKYLSSKSLATFLDVSEQTARAIIKGVQKEIGPGRRYSSPYVIAGSGRTLRVAAAAAVDYSKYADALKDPSARAGLPAFDISKAEREMGLQLTAAGMGLDYEAMAAAIVRQMRLPLLPTAM